MAFAASFPTHVYRPSYAHTGRAYHYRAARACTELAAACPLPPARAVPHLEDKNWQDPIGVSLHKFICGEGKNLALDDAKRCVKMNGFFAETQTPASAPVDLESVATEDHWWEGGKWVEVNQPIPTPPLCLLFKVYPPLRQKFGSLWRGKSVAQPAREIGPFAV